MDLRCPYCEGSLFSTTETEGSNWLPREVAGPIECADWKCGAEWDRYGNLTQPGRSQ